ncbi:MAG: hypothetical protein ACYT04_99930, partial [Nostoc sp.]
PTFKISEQRSGETLVQLNANYLLQASKRLLSALSTLHLKIKSVLFLVPILPMGMPSLSL